MSYQDERDHAEEHYNGELLRNPDPDPMRHHVVELLNLDGDVDGWACACGYGTRQPRRLASIRRHAQQREAEQ